MRLENLKSGMQLICIKQCRRSVRVGDIVTLNVYKSNRLTGFNTMYKLVEHPAVYMYSVSADEFRVFTEFERRVRDAT